MDDIFKIPKKVLIKGHLWKIRKLKKVIHEDGEECRGIADHSNRTITIEKGMPAQEELSVFLHEMIHAALAEAHLHEGSGLSGQVEEIVCDAVADMLVGCFNVEVKNVKKSKTA